MTPSQAIEATTLAIVTVTFNPCLDVLEVQLRALPDNCTKIIVDNASAPDTANQLELLAARLTNVELLRNIHNLGLAAAINLGVRRANELAARPRFVLLLDQDSEPQLGSIETLLSGFATLETNGVKVGCVGPLLLDPDTGLTHGFHQVDRWRWKRAYPQKASTAPLPCASLNGSGTLAPLSLFLELGGLDESLFIDHVDTEWSFRVLSAGYSLWGIPDATFSHRMGQTGARLWFFGWRVWPVRTPNRHYFLFRNAITLLRRPYVPTVWKTWAVLKLMLTIIVVALAGPERVRQLASINRGVRSGFSFKEKLDE